jgi:hypothetical protein
VIKQIITKYIMIRCYTASQILLHLNLQKVHHVQCSQNQIPTRFFDGGRSEQHQMRRSIGMFHNEA